VIGGGVAGMEAAKILHERGHEVTLFEATNQLGGEFLLAGEAPCNLPVYKLLRSI
jgi:NADPH-dependent 2,4-dienoyl-CoA reductase/sulfur reductase-like enzyme